MLNGAVTREEFNRLDHDVNGDGQPGLRQEVAQYGAQLSEIRGAQKERERIDKARWTVQTIIISALTLAVGILALLLGVHESRNGELVWPSAPHKSLAAPQKPEYAIEKTPQDAGTDPNRAY
jgi:hypothetical protein